MKELLDSLNPAQLEAVTHAGHCCVIATAGSGKTKMLAVKAARRLSEGARVAAVTFTKEAALELRSRIVEYAGPGCRQRLLVGTFHSVDMLMAFPGKTNGIFGGSILADIKTPFTEPWNLVKEGVRRSYLIRAMQEANVSMKLDEATAIIESIKDARSLAGYEDNVVEMFETYCSQMRDAKVIDFQDIILKTNEALRDKLLTALPVDDLLIDEFQDTDKAQFEWATHHGKAGISVTAVGDDDQSIYGFRRALGYEGLQKFTKEFNARRIMLGSNYRCRSEILSAASILIGRNTERIEKQIVAAKGEGGIVMWEIFDDKSSEANAVAEEAFLAQGEGVSFAVISRTNNELIEVERSLIDRGIPFKKADGSSIFDRPEIQVYAALLRSIINPKPNDVDLVLAWAGLSASDAAEVRKLFGTAIRMGSKADFQNSKMSEAGIDIWRSFAKKHSEWINLHSHKLFSLLNVGVHSWLSDHIQKPNNIEILKTAYYMFEVETGTLEDRVKQMRDAENNVKDKKVVGNPIYLLTAHGSKGLEFDRVWIIGMEQGVFPSEKSSLEEERRLMFVAITRAKEILMVSATKLKKASIFLSESGIKTK